MRRPWAIDKGTMAGLGNSAESRLMRPIQRPSDRETCTLAYWVMRGRRWAVYSTCRLLTRSPQNVANRRLLMLTIRAESCMVWLVHLTQVQRHISPRVQYTENSTSPTGHLYHELHYHVSRNIINKATCFTIQKHHAQLSQRPHTTLLE